MAAPSPQPTPQTLAAQRILGCPDASALASALASAASALCGLSDAAVVTLLPGEPPSSPLRPAGSQATAAVGEGAPPPAPAGPIRAQLVLPSGGGTFWPRLLGACSIDGLPLATEVDGELWEGLLGRRPDHLGPADGARLLAALLQSQQAPVASALQAVGAPGLMVQPLGGWDEVPLPGLLIAPAPAGPLSAQRLQALGLLAVHGGAALRLQGLQQRVKTVSSQASVLVARLERLTVMLGDLQGVTEAREAIEAVLLELSAQGILAMVMLRLGGSREFEIAASSFPQQTLAFGSRLAGLSAIPTRLVLPRSLEASVLGGAQPMDFSRDRATLRRAIGEAVPGADVDRIVELYGAERSILLPLPGPAESPGLLWAAPSLDRGPLSEAERALLALIAGQLGLVLERTATLHDLERRNGQLSLVSALGQRLLLSHDTEELWTLLAREIHDAFGYGSVGVFQRTGETLLLRSAAGYGAALALEGYTQSVDQGLVGWAVTNGQPVVVGDVRTDIRYLPCPKGPGLSALVVPIIIPHVQRFAAAAAETPSPGRTVGAEVRSPSVGAEEPRGGRTQGRGGGVLEPVPRGPRSVVGAINLESVQTHAFDRWDVMAMNALARQVGSILVSHRLQQVERLRSRQLELVSAISTRVGRHTDLRTFLEHLSAELATAFGYADLSYWAAEGEELVLQHHSGRLLRGMSGGFRMPQEEGIPGWACRHRRVVLCNDTLADDRYVDHGEGGIRSQLVAPVMEGPRVLGVLVVSEGRVGRFDQYDALAMEALAKQIADGLRETKVRDEVDLRARQLELLAELSLEAREQRDLPQLLEVVAERLRRTFGYEDVTVWLTEEDGRHVRLWSRANTTLGNTDLGHRLGASQGAIGWVLRHRRSRLIADTSTDPYYLPPSFGTMASQLTIPIQDRAHQKVVGIINIESRATGAFDQWDQLVLETLALQLEGAIPDISAPTRGRHAPRRERSKVGGRDPPPS